MQIKLVKIKGRYQPEQERFNSIFSHICDGMKSITEPWGWMGIAAAHGVQFWWNVEEDKAKPSITPEYVNCTPHVVRVHDENGDVVKQFPPTGIIPRVTQEMQKVSDEGITPALYRQTLGGIENLPEPKHGMMYIVSFMVMDATDRTDVVAPMSGAGAKRDENGQIVSVQGFICK